MKPLDRTNECSIIDDMKQMKMFHRLHIANEPLTERKTQTMEKRWKSSVVSTSRSDICLTMMKRCFHPHFEISAFNSSFSHLVDQTNTIAKTHSS